MAKKKSEEKVKSFNFSSTYNDEIQNILNEIHNEIVIFGDFETIRNVSVNDKKKYLSERINKRIDILSRLRQTAEPLIKPLLDKNDFFHCPFGKVKYNGVVGAVIEALPLITAPYTASKIFVDDDNKEFQGTEIYYSTFPYGKLTQKEIIKFHNDIDLLEEFVLSFPDNSEDQKDTTKERVAIEFTDQRIEELEHCKNNLRWFSYSTVENVQKGEKINILKSKHDAITLMTLWGLQEEGTANRRDKIIADNFTYKGKQFQSSAIQKMRKNHNETTLLNHLKESLQQPFQK